MLDTSTKPSVAIRDAANQAAHVAAQTAITKAVENAAKPGTKTSEFWASVLGPALAGGGIAFLKVIGAPLTVAMPWVGIPLVMATAAVATFGYSMSRGNVKAAAIAAGTAAVTAGSAEALNQAADALGMRLPPATPPAR